MEKLFLPSRSLGVRVSGLLALLLLLHLANTGRLLWLEHREIFWAIGDLFYPFGAFILLVILIALGSLAALGARLAEAPRPLRGWRPLRVAAAVIAVSTLAIAGTIVAGEVELFLAGLARFDRFALFFAAGVLNAIGCLVLVSRARRCPG